MKVGQIFEFISQLPSQGLGPTDVDQLLIDSLKRHFSTRNKEDLLNDDDIAFIRNQFNERAIKSLDTDRDCTLFPNHPINIIWERLARAIAEEQETISYLEFLLPQAHNPRDFNNKNYDYKKVSSPADIFFGQSPNDVYFTIYSKECLIKHISEHKGGLSTTATADLKNLRALKLIELSRLRRCTQNLRVDGVDCGTFWFFLYKNILPKINSKQQVVYYLLPFLLNLIESYHDSKTKKLDFFLFKSKHWTVFLDFLYKLGLDDINNFYGLITEDGTYLVDLLIDIQEANDYTLDAQFQSLLACVMQFYPAMTHANKSLEAEIQALRKKGTPVLSAFDASLASKKILIALFTDSFERTAQSQAIDCCGIKNIVPAELESFYVSSVLPVLEGNDVGEIALIYDETIPKHLNLQCNWYAPELIIHALRYFRYITKEYDEVTDLLLDLVVHAYYDRPSLNKQLCINLVFHDILRKIDGENKRTLLILLDLYADELSQNTFLDDCFSYLGRRLGAMNLSFRCEPKSMYSTIAKETHIILRSGAKKLLCVKDIVDAYRAQLAPNATPTIVRYPSEVHALRERYIDYFERLTTQEFTLGQPSLLRERALDSLGASV